MDRSKVCCIVAAACMASASAQAAWKGRGEAGLVFARGNTQTDSINLKLEMTKEVDRWKHQLDMAALRATTAGLATAKRYQAGWQSNYQFSDRGFYFGGVVSQTAESSDVLDGFVHTRDEARGYGITNHSRYSNPRADALIEEAATMPVMLRRLDLLQEAMRVVMADLEFVPIAGLYDVYGVRDGVRFTPRLDLKLLGREIARP